MADTQRTIPALLTLLADNTAGDISPQDIRDMLVTLVPGLGTIYISTPTETTVAAANTPLKAAGTTTLLATAQNFTMPANNRLTYTGTPDVLANVSISISMTAAANNKVVTMYVAENGTPVAASAVERKVGTGADVGALSVQYALTLSTNDYVELFVENNTDDTNLTIENMVMQVTTAPIAA